MKRVGLLTAVLAGLLLAAPQADAAHWRHCGEPNWAKSDRGGMLIAKRTTCRRAQGVTTRFVRRIQSSYAPVIKGYTCSGGSYHGSSHRFYILCVNGRKKIKWVGNSAAIFGATY